MLGEATAITVAEGSYAARVGVERFKRPWGLGEFKDQSRTVSSREQERNESEAGLTARVVTGAVCPLK